MAKEKEQKDLKSLLGQIATDAPAAASKNPKKKYPIIKLDKDNSTRLKKFNEYKKTFKEAKTNMELEEQPLLSLVEAERRKLALAGTYNGTFELVTVDGKEPSKCISTDKFSVTTDPETLAEFKKTVGDDYKDLIVETTTAAIKPEVLEDPKRAAELVKLIGEKNLGQFLDVVVKRSTCEGFDEKRFKYGADKLEVIDRACKQNKAYIK